MTATADSAWRLMTDADLARALTSHRRALALVDEENPDIEIRESTRQFLAALVDDGEAEDARRQRAAQLGIPRDAARFSPAFLDTIRCAVRLDDLLIHHADARLRKPNAKGIRRGPCPFCQTSEVSSALVVSVGDPANQWYYCFANGHGGDCFQAIMQTYGVEFPEAVERLAREGGVPLPEKPKPTAAPASANGHANGTGRRPLPIRRNKGS